MWRGVVVLLLYLPVCWTQDYLYRDEDIEEDDDYYTDFYYNYAGDTTVTTGLTTFTDRIMWRATFGPNILRSTVDRDAMISKYSMRPGQSVDPIKDKSINDAFSKYMQSTTPNRDRGKWADVANQGRMTSTTPRKATTKTIHIDTMAKTTYRFVTARPTTEYADITRETTPRQISTTRIKTHPRRTTKKRSTKRKGTYYPPGVRTYWANNSPHTYPRSIFANGTWHMLPPDWPFHTEPNHTCAIVTTTKKPTTTTPKVTLRLDVVGLLDLIANLTYEYDMNLTERFNETLIKYSVPTCPTPTTTVTPSPTTAQYDFANASIVGKCFVCGLEKKEIPQDAYCADAFAGDFLPLVPIDPRARGQIARYRKYCRFLDIRHIELNADEPRAVYGRFTGGCSVRWTDLSGIYTQRTCRNKRRAVLGKHFASKRMAKLEMALNHLDNGCIISPMATLLPLSRGVSLYARFHACVCTGAWCNRSLLNEPWMVNIVIPFWFFTYR